MSAQADLAALRIDRTRPRRRNLWPYFLILFVLAALFKAPAVLRSIKGVEVAAASVVKASTLSPIASKGASELSATGYVVADRKSTVASKYTARLKKLLVSESQEVKAHELVAELDCDELQAQIKHAEAQAAQARAECARLKAAAAQAETEIAVAAAPLTTLDAEMTELKVLQADAERRLVRDRALARENALAASSADDRQTEVNMAIAKIDTLKERRREVEMRVVSARAQAETARSAALVSEAQAQVAQAYLGVLGEQLKEAHIRSPFDGVVIEKTAEVGEIVAPISVGGTMAKGSIVTIAAWDSLQAEVDVSEAYIGRVKPGGRAQITVDALPGKFFPGRVKRILPRAERSKATVQVRIEFIKLDSGVLPDMSIRVKFLPDNAPEDAELGLIPEKLLVHKKAVQGSGANTYVWLFTENKVARKTVDVIPLPAQEGAGSTPAAAAGSPGTENATPATEWLLVKNGLAAGDKVVIEGAEQLTEDGQKAQLREK